MDLMFASATGLVVLVVVFVWMGIWFQRSVSSSEDFLLAGRKIPFWLLAAAYLGGFIGGASVSGYAGYGFSGGLSQFWVALWVIVGVTLYIVLFARRVNHFGRKTGAQTLADFMCARYGESIRLPAAIISFFRPGFITGMQYLALAVVLNVAFNLPIAYGVVISAVIMLLYTITGGQYSALVTQWLQALLQSVGILVFAIAAFRVLSGDVGTVTNMLYTVIPPKFMDFWAFNPTMLSVWFLTFCLFYLVDPWMYMWAYVAESPRTSSNAQLAILSGSFFTVLPFLGGIALFAASTTGALAIPSKVSPDGLYSWFAMNRLGVAVGAVLIIGLAMTILSCASSFLMNGATIITRDIYLKTVNPRATDQQLLRVGRLSVLGVTVFGIATALWLPILVPLWTLAQALVISGLLAPMLAAWFWKRATTSGAFVSAVAGGLAGIGWAVVCWLQTGSPGGLVYGLHAAHVGLIVSVPLMIIVSLATKPEYEKAAVTSWADLGRSLAAASVGSEGEEKGVFGWLGARSGVEKVGWVVTFVLFALHFILPSLARIQVFGLALNWVSLIASIGLFIVLIALGARDVWRIMSAARVRRVEAPEVR